MDQPNQPTGERGRPSAAAEPSKISPSAIHRDPQHEKAVEGRHGLREFLGWILSGRLWHRSRGLKENVFVSFATADRVECDDVRRRLDLALETSGNTTWAYLGKMTAGGDWRKQVTEQIDKAKIFLLLVSPRSNEADEVDREISYALEYKKVILAFYLEKVKLSKVRQLAIGNLQDANRDVENWRDDIPKLLHRIQELLKIGGLPRPRRIDRLRLWTLAQRDRMVRVWQWLAGFTLFLFLLVVATFCVLLYAGILKLWPPSPSPVERDKYAAIEVSQRGARAIALSRERHADATPNLIMTEFGRKDWQGEMGLDAQRRLHPIVGLQDVYQAIDGLLDSLRKEGYPSDHIWIVASSGFGSGNGEMLRKRFVDTGETKRVEVLLPKDQLSYLLSSIQEEFGKQLDIKNTIVIEVDGENIKGVYRNPGLGKIDLPYTVGILEFVPGPVALNSWIIQRHQMPLEEPEDRAKFSSIVAQECLGTIETNLRREADRCPMLERSSQVFLAGETVRAMSQMLYPQRQDRYPPIKPDDFNAFRTRLISDDMKILNVHLGNTMSLGQALTGAEILLAVERSLRFAQPNREIRCVGHSDFDWLREFLERKILESTASELGQRR